MTSLFKYAKSMTISFGNKEDNSYVFKMKGFVIKYYEDSKSLEIYSGSELLYAGEGGDGDWITEKDEVLDAVMNMIGIIDIDRWWEEE